ncbi:MAG: tRNA uridine-5-carboxymethylaminomethyl(34) synthesis GTPase MnmE [Treponema sp.]|nr:tRNA uridine-5-carboxymethylaminomethyl(34) synthesis GTPase MnmE [Treponema sp.]
MDNTGYTPEEPVAAIATSLAPAALGIVRTSGKRCIELVASIFSRPKTLLAAQGNTIVYGWIKDGDTLIDEVLLSVFKAPKSFTGEDMVEISCHGGPAVVTAVYNTLLKIGFRQAQKGEYTFRAYINGKTDLTRAEAVREIIDSRTDVSRGRAAGRLAGDVYTVIDGIKKQIVDSLAALEVEIEYPEDEETIADAFDTSELQKAAESLQQLVDSWKNEKLYQDGARVVLCGRTNAGKSSLFNALLKEDRAIVSNIAGTTRDWLESWISLDGIPVRLFDTAGLRMTTDVIEQNGVERTKDLSKDADVIMYMVDSHVGIHEDDVAFITSCTVPLVLVWNKCDVVDETHRPSLEHVEKLSVVKQQVYISAKKSEGIGELTKAVTGILTAGNKTDREQAGLGSARQQAAVKDALSCVLHALETAKGGYTLDAVVQDLEDCLDSLGEVTGEVTPDDVLESIFSHFCVGK